MRWGEGFVLVYDITDRGSFEEVLPLKNILDEIDHSVIKENKGKFRKTATGDAYSLV